MRIFKNYVLKTLRERVKGVRETPRKKLRKGYREIMTERVKRQKR